MRVAEGKRKLVAQLAGGGEGTALPDVVLAAAGRLPEGGWAGYSRRVEQLTCSWLPASSPPPPPPPDPRRPLRAKTRLATGPPAQIFELAAKAPLQLLLKIVIMAKSFINGVFRPKAIAHLSNI
jgi:hypothetical protein